MRLLAFCFQKPLHFIQIAMKTRILTFVTLLTTLLASGAATAQFLGTTALLTGFKAERFQSSFHKETPLKRAIPFKGKFSLDLTNGVVGTGVATYVGSFTMVALDNEDGFPYITGTVIITAADGDEIFAIHTGYFQNLSNGRAVVNFRNIITGGTGRFAGASGQFTMHALLNQTLGTGRATLDGMIRD